MKRSNSYRQLIPLASAQEPTVVVDGKNYIMLASSNYLGLSNHPKLIQAAQDAAEQFGFGSGGSRLITGNTTLHEKLEFAIAKYLGTEAAILFNSGYDANIGAISALMTGDTVIFSDELNHASIIDGCQLARAKTVIYKHNNMQDLEKKLKKIGTGKKRYSKKFIITDTIFSMDGDLAALQELTELAAHYDAFVMVDEAHAVGVFGDSGGGVVEFLGVEDKIDIRMGALSKAFGTTGGYIAGSNELIDYLRNRARSFIYTTSLPAPILASGLAAIEIVRLEPELRAKLWANIEYFKKALDDYGFNTMSSSSQIIPILIGSIEDTMAFSRYLFETGIFVTGIRPPTVPPGKCRIRTTMMANHSKSDLESVVKIFRKYNI